MYSTFANQFYHLMHYGFSFLLIGIIAPFFVFSQTFANKGDQLISNYIRSVFIIIILGYLLVITKLYEVLSLIFIYLFIIGLLYLPMWKKVLGENSIFQVIFRLFDMLDGLIHFDKNASKKKVTSLPKSLLDKWKVLYHNREAFGKLIVLVFLFGYSFFIRFYDAVKHAAPPLSDSYVTLAWMKYISNRMLFHDGIYPQGFHIYLATLQKFAAIDPIYVLKYTGPLQAFFMIVMIYFFINRLTGHFLAAVIAAGIYGLAAPYIMFNSTERQIATNSQEFAFLFIYPALYFLSEYFLTKKKEALVTGILATAIIGLVHSLAFAYIGLAIGLLMITQLLLMGKKAWGSVVKVALFSIGAVVLSLIPLGIGEVLGKQVHSSSADYLTSTSKVELTYPTLHVMDYVSLFGLLVLSISLFNKKNSFKEKTLILFTLLLGLAMFFLFFAGGVVTNSVLISSRSMDLWALTIPLIIGISVYLLTKTAKPVVQWTFIAALILFLTVYIRPAPIEAYKMERDIQVEQYLQIRDSHTPKSFMIVSQDEGYAKIYGIGIHMYLKDFLERYDPTKPALTIVGSDEMDYNVPPDVYVFHEKKIFEVSKKNGIYSLLEPKYEQRKQDNKNFKKWIATYLQHGHKVDKTYEDQNFAVYHFYIPPIQKKERKRFWED